MKTTKVVFLDIDGVLQPSMQYRHEHIKAGHLDQLYIELKEKHGIDYSLYDKYDVAATYWDWNKKSVALLREILDETNSQIVVSSDWRRKDFFVELLKIHDLDGYYRGKTPYKPYSRLREGLQLVIELEKDLGIDQLNRGPHGNRKYYDRCVEIAYYVKNNPDIINYVAIDDETLLRHLGEHHIETFPHIKDADRDRAILALNNEALYFDNIWEKWKQQLQSEQ